MCVCMYVRVYVCMYEEFVLLDAHLGNGTGHSTVTMMAPLLLLLILLTSGVVT